MANYSDKQAIGFHSGYDGHAIIYPTIPNDISSYLVEAEKLFGQRDSSFTFLGIEFADPGTGPRLRFSAYDHKHMIIVLSYAAMAGLSTSISELSQEIAHLLGPKPGGDAPVIEEGMATYFGRKICSDRSIKFPGIPNNYNEAATAFDVLMKENVNAVSSLRALRNGTLFGITAAEIQRIAPNLDPTISQKLGENSFISLAC